ncbi:MAG: hypothetical protein AAF066_02290 [Pseudomonadota bacterium]
MSGAQDGDKSGQRVSAQPIMAKDKPINQHSTTPAADTLSSGSAEPMAPDKSLPSDKQNGATTDAGRWRLAGHGLVVLISSAAIWMMISSVYFDRGYRAPVAEFRYDHDCAAPPRFLVRATTLPKRPGSLSFYVQIENYLEIGQTCTFIDLYMLPQGSKALTVSNLSEMLARESFIALEQGKGFALRLAEDDGGHRLPPIDIDAVIHRRNVEDRFFWAHFSGRRDEPGAGMSRLVLEIMPSDHYLIDDLALRNGALGTVFGDQATITLSPGQGMAIDLLEKNAQHRFALLNVVIGVLASIASGSLTVLAGALLRSHRHKRY